MSAKETFKHRVITCALGVGALLSFYFFWKSLAFNMFSLLTVMSFAIVGRGNRKIWLLVLPMAMLLIIVGPFALLQYGASNIGGIFFPLMEFILMTVSPGMLLVFSYQFGKWRAKRLTRRSTLTRKRASVRAHLDKYRRSDLCEQSRY